MRFYRGPGGLVVYNMDPASNAFTRFCVNLLFPRGANLDARRGRWIDFS